jgi:aspartyl-tRNA(Asn)/glutamyl-tRNA(Gln) amidotransferase subunit A
MRPLTPAISDGLRLAVPRSYLLENLDPAVARAFEEALGRLGRAGAKIVELALPSLDRIPGLTAKGGVIAPEALAWHRELLRERGEDYDPRVRARILRGREQDASEYAELLRTRLALCAEIDAATAGVDALVTPTVAVPPPRIADLDDDGEFTRMNVLVLRNTSAWNFLDLPAISIPCSGADLPTGLMLAGRRGHDRRLLDIAQAVEASLRAH